MDSNTSNAFLTLKKSVMQAPILHYPDPKKHYIVYTDASDDAYRSQLSQEHDDMDFPWPSSHTHLQKLNENGLPQNKKPMLYIM